jgi:hypothetical protein
LKKLSGNQHSSLLVVGVSGIENSFKTLASVRHGGVEHGQSEGGGGSLQSCKFLFSFCI